MAEYTEYETFTPYGIFDCDQHIYEPPDCYTSRIESKYADQTLREGVVNGEKVMLAMDRVVPVDNKVDECYRPGSLKEMLKTMKRGSAEEGGYQWMKIDQAFLDRGLRLTQMDMQNVDGAILYCGSLGLFAEHFLTDDDLYWASSWAYLRWLEDTWGFSHNNRMFMSPVISMRDSPGWFSRPAR